METGLPFQLGRVLIHCLYIDFRSATRGIKKQHLKKIKGENFQGKPPRIVSPVSPVKLYCSYIMNVVLTVAVILSTAWSQSGTVYISVRKEKLVNKSLRPCYADCPRHWIGFESKCFYFSGDMGNWTFSQTYCMAQEAQLALFESLEELDFLKRYKGDYDHWIGLHRESTQHPWRWTDNTEYNNLVPIRGEGGYAYLSDKVISSGRVYMNRKWICSKPIAILYNDFKTWVGNVSTHA